MNVGQVSGNIVPVNMKMIDDKFFHGLKVKFLRT